MNLSNAWKSYRQTATRTAPPGQLVLMLYDGAIRFSERALEGFQQDDPATSNMTINNNLQRAQEIIQELNWSLNMDEGGEVAVVLRQLYEYLDRRLHESNVKKEQEGIRESIRRLAVLRDAWSTMLRKQDAAQAEERFGAPVLAAA